MTKNGKHYGYRLAVRLEIVKLECQGYGDDGSGPGPHETCYWNTVRTNDRLSVEENIDLGELDFAGVLKVLSQMHTAVAAIAPPMHAAVAATTPREGQ